MYVCKKYKTTQNMNTISIDPNLYKGADLSPEVKSLIGIAKPSSPKEDINGRDARMEYLNEKYTL